MRNLVTGPAKTTEVVPTMALQRRILFWGGRVRGGFYGEQPPLDRLEGQNLADRLDFRALYATVARRWWGLDGKFLGPRTLPLIN